MRISDWSSDVCSSDLDPQRRQLLAVDQLVYPVLDVAPQLRTAVGRLDAQGARQATVEVGTAEVGFRQVDDPVAMGVEGTRQVAQGGGLAHAGFAGKQTDTGRSEENTSELQSLMRTSYAVLCLQTKKQHNTTKSQLLRLLAMIVICTK